jgi:membrane protease YdiL (CAAX protease family)
MCRISGRNSVWMKTFMTTPETFVKRHSVLAYFSLVFIISWGGILLITAPSGLPGTLDSTMMLLPIAVVAIVAGPSVSGVLLTALVHGRAGLHDFRSRLTWWRVGIRWYAIALFAAPVLFTAVLGVLTLFSPAYLPGVITSDNPTSYVLIGIFIALMAGIFEELGWTGFAIPELRQRYGIIITGLIVGILWAIWHELPAYWLSGTVSGPLALISYMLDPFFFLVPFRVLMVWVYDRTGSLPVAMLMHTSLTASARILAPLAISGVILLTFDLVWAVMLWGVVGGVAITLRKKRAMV